MARPPFHDIGSFNFGAHGGSGFGMQDWHHARSLAYNDAQMRVLGSLSQSRGLPMGIEVQRSFDHMGNSQKLPWDYAADGGWGMGLSDIQGMTDRKWKYDQIAGARDFAVNNSINVGSGARAWMDENKNNPEYMSYGQLEAYNTKKTEEDDAKRHAEWLKQQEISKAMNPNTTSQGASIRIGDAGGVKLNRSEAWKKSGTGGRNRSTTQLNRSMLIGGLNI